VSVNGAPERDVSEKAAAVLMDVGHAEKTDRRSMVNSEW